MKYVEALDEWNRYITGENSIFLAGGITSCPDWQQEMVKLLSETDFTLLNPRQKNFPIGEPEAAREQISWEYRHLREAYSILFWFPEETLCPIVLFELGYWLARDKPLFIGVHPNYARRQDVEIQTDLEWPGGQIAYSLEDLAQQVIDWR